MATAANSTRPLGLDEPVRLGRRILALVPGLLLLTAVGYAGKFIEQSIAAYTKGHHITFPNIEYVLWAIVTLGYFTRPQLTSLANLSRWAFLLTFAGVGLRTSFRELGKQGWRPFAVGAIGEVFIALVTLALVYGADRFLHL